MGRQKNMPSTKQQEENPRKELNEIEKSNLPHIDVKTMLLKMIKEHRRIDENSEMSTQRQ